MIGDVGREFLKLELVIEGMVLNLFFRLGYVIHLRQKLQNILHQLHYYQGMV